MVLGAQKRPCGGKFILPKKGVYGLLKQLDCCLRSWSDKGPTLDLLQHAFVLWQTVVQDFFDF